MLGAGALGQYDRVPGLACGAGPIAGARRRAAPPGGIGATGVAFGALAAAPRPGRAATRCPRAGRRAAPGGPACARAWRAAASASRRRRAPRGSEHALCTRAPARSRTCRHDAPLRGRRTRRRWRSSPACSSVRPRCPASARAQAGLSVCAASHARPWRAFAPVALEHGVVGDLVQQLVAEQRIRAAYLRCRGAAFAAARARAAPAPANVARARARCRQRLVPEHRADDAGLLQRAPLGRRQAVETRLQHAGERGRHLGHQQASASTSSVAGLDRPLVDSIFTSLPCRTASRRRRR